MKETWERRCTVTGGEGQGGAADCKGIDWILLSIWGVTKWLIATAAQTEFKLCTRRFGFVKEKECGMESLAASPQFSISLVVPITPFSLMGSKGLCFPCDRFLNCGYGQNSRYVYNLII